MTVPMYGALFQFGHSTLSPVWHMATVLMFFDSFKWQPDSGYDFFKLVSLLHHFEAV